MATVIVAAWQVGKAGQGSSAPAVARGAPRARQAITSEAGNTVSTVIAAQGETLVVSASGNAIRVAVAEGADPNAATAAQFLVGDGGIFAVEAIKDDTRIAVADV